MSVREISWRRFGLRTLFAVTFSAAMFFGGYRLGYHAGQEAETWNDVGGPGTIRGFTTVIDGCFDLEDPTDPFAEDPFGDADDDPFAEAEGDPFADTSSASTAE